MFGRLGLFIAARSRLILAASLILVAVFVVLAAGLFGRLLDEGFDDPSSQSSRAKILLDQRFGGESDIVFLVHARTGTVDDPAVAKSGQELTGFLRRDQRLDQVSSYWSNHSPALRSRDGSDALILAHVVGDPDAILKDYGHVDNAVATLRIGGDKGTDVGAQVGKDLAVAEAIAVPITLILLILAFGSVVAALLPLGIARARHLRHLRRAQPAHPRHERQHLRDQPHDRTGPRPRDRLRAADGEPVP